MTKKEELYKFFSENENLERLSAIENAVAVIGVSKTTAMTYYSEWRRDYMKIKPVTEKEFKKDIEKAVEKSTSLGAIEEMLINTNEEKKDTIKLIPVVFKGPVFMFAINEKGVKIIDGNSDMVTIDIVEEQLKALKIYKDLYGSKKQ